MEAKAEALGLGGELRYISPNQGRFLNPSDLAKAAALGAPAPHQLLADFHVEGGGAIDGARELFGANPNFSMGAVNLETNAGTHHMGEAKDAATCSFLGRVGRRRGNNVPTRPTPTPPERPPLSSQLSSCSHILY
jgi:hypothetical protein